MFNYNPTINTLRQKSIEKAKELKEKIEYIEGYIWCDKDQNNFTDGILKYGQNEIYAVLEFTQYAVGKMARIEVINRTSGNLIETKNIRISSKRMLVGFDEEKIFNSCDGQTINFFVLKIYVEKDIFYPDPKFPNMNLKIHFVILIPKIMKKLGWRRAEKSQIEWFEGKANNYPWESEPKLNYFYLGDLMHFDRFKKFYNEHLNDWKSQKSISLLKTRILEMHEDNSFELTFPDSKNPKVSFGTISGTPVRKIILPEELSKKTDNKAIEIIPEFEKYYINYAAYSESFLNSLDDFFGTIANCSVRFIALGNLHYQNGKIMVEINKIGTYVKDAFDFVDSDKLKDAVINSSTNFRNSQPLGTWSYKNNIVSKFGSGSSIDNKAYRDYRIDTMKGRDCYRYSNIYFQNVNYPLFEL